ncbi:MAG: hypothetical protein HKN82_13330 [Akkermansiaceae bacterium]|nr:hypothetical protein [Akkermansiaceae bacterium]NNM29438.1 hypothetical protein [Akkermansiaceae bacterium]
MNHAELTLPERPSALHLLAVLDVLVLMLVLFLLVTSVSQEAGFPVDLAESQFRLGNVGKPVLVTARGGAHPVISVGRERGSMADLEANLEAARVETGADSVLIEADKHITLEVWMGILNSCHKLGMRPMVVGKLPAGRDPAAIADDAAPLEPPPADGPPTP